MNELALRLSLPVRPILYVPVSLWDMLNLNLQALMFVLIHIRNEIGRSQEGARGAATADARDRAERRWQRLSVQCQPPHWRHLHYSGRLQSGRSCRTQKQCPHAGGAGMEQ